MKFTAFTGLFVLASAVAATPIDKRDACPDPLAMIRPILRQIDLKKLDWTKIMADYKPLINDFKPMIPKLAADFGPIMNDFKPLFADIDWSKLGSS